MNIDCSANYTPRATTLGQMERISGITKGFRVHTLSDELDLLLPERYSDWARHRRLMD
jgi:hypothetical protein